MSNHFRHFSGSIECNFPSFLHYVQLEREDGEYYVPVIVVKEYREFDFSPPERWDGNSFVPVIH